MLNKFDLQNKNALITGGAGLLGYEHAFALSECNANIILTDINLSKLKIAKRKLSKIFSNKIIILKMDVSSLKSIKNVNQKLLEKNIFIDILINNAAIDPKPNTKLLSRLEDLDILQWNQEILIGLTGAFLCTQVFGSLMAKEKKGVILNIASDLSIIAPDQRIYKKRGQKDVDQDVKPVTYSVIKHGIIGLTKYTASYWANKNIRCNAISPGGIKNNQNQEFVRKISKLIPIGRMAKKDEYRSAIQFMCSEASSYMTGQNIVIDGGRSIL